MIWYKVSFKMHSWTASAWQADTVFGHLCWAMLHLQGEDKLAAFLNEYKAGSPPLLLSNGFPADLLPVPICEPAQLDVSLDIEKQKQQLSVLKEQSKIQFTVLADFNSFLSGRPCQLKEPQYVSESRSTLKNRLDRQSGTTTPGGQLFNFEEHYTPEISIYLKLRPDFKPMAEKLFGYLKDTGYGKRKSVGYGQIEKMEITQFSGFASPPKSNGFVSLSNFTPAAGDPVTGRWKTIIKYGRMGEAYAQEDHAFKKPLVMLAAGSTFYSDTQREFYGRMVHGLNPHYPQALHYAFALPVPMQLA